jgi:hypothetical protein
MRSFLAGILLLILPSVTFAQARGQVESVGFGDYFRPGCWTPMLVYLVPTSGSPFTGRIEVVQEDLDRDQVLFTRQITLTGNPAGGSAVEQRFWMYFMPQPNKGRESLDDTQSVAELSNLIKVRLCNENGKELVKLPITRTLRPVGLRAGIGGYGGTSRGEKMVLCVYDKSAPNLAEYANTLTAGLTEEVVQLTARDMAKDLPDSVIGYDAIDAILWSDADPTKLSADQLAALEQFVKRGGQLVISQDTAVNQWQRNNTAFSLLMPVTVRGVEERDDRLPTLRELAHVNLPLGDPEINNPWDRLKGPFRYAVADPRPGASVIAWQKDAQGNLLLDANGKPKPYAVRSAAGAGSVTWVAQDLSDRQILGRTDSTTGWVFVWDKLFDWPNESLPTRGRDPSKDPAFQPYSAGSTWELGRSFLRYMDLPSTSAALIGIAVLFFIVYWVAAGPGSYLVLLKKGRSMMSWFAFAAIAIAATGLTVGIVKLVLRGAPKLQHVSFVRMTRGEPVHVHSDFGLYIPRDGEQKIELKNTAPNRASYVTAFNLHPAFNGESAEFPARQTYQVPVKEIHEGEREVADPHTIYVPYRSTLKKFQADWVGKSTANAQDPTALPPGIDGAVALSPTIPLVTGKLTNNTGHDLQMVYLVVNNPGIQRDTTVSEDLVLYVSFWPKGNQIDLGHEFQTPGNGGAKFVQSQSLENSSVVRDNLFDDSNPTALKTFQGSIGPDTRTIFRGNWTDYWYNENPWRGGSADTHEWEEDRPLRPKSFAILSFFDRIPVSRNRSRQQPQYEHDRVDFLRRGLRHLDLSPAISGGKMAIIAVCTSENEPLPFPLEVQGDAIAGKGVVYYQFIIPVDRSAVLKDPTQATTQPATAPATQKGKAGG